MAMAMRRAAIYARYSTDHQNDRSIEDQFALCEEYARRNGFVIVARHSDAARSGGAVAGRPGLADLIAAAQRGEFGAVIVEALDRISRDMEDLAGIHKRFRFAGIDLIAVHEGVASTILVGLRGLIGQLYREDGAQKIRRGLSGVIRAGRNPGGAHYGYRHVPGSPGLLVIEEDEAAVIRRIYAEYASGHSARRIASVLNRDGIASARGGTWNATTLNGDRDRETGILLNPIYRGEMVWNRTTMIRDPDTGRRVHRDNPKADWIRVPAPELAIVDPDTASAVIARRAAAASDTPPPRTRNTRLLSGLLRCGHCGRAMSMAGTVRRRPMISCNAGKFSGTCPAGSRRVFLDPIEDAVVSGLREQISNPAAMARYVEAFNAKRNAEAASAARDEEQAKRRLAEIGRDIDRVVDAIATGVLSPDEARPRMERLRADKADQASRLAAAQADRNVVALHPAAIDAYQRDLASLALRLDKAVATDAKARAAFRALVAAVIVTVGPPYRPSLVEVRGRLGAILGAALPPDRVASVAGIAVSQERHDQAIYSYTCLSKPPRCPRCGRLLHNPGPS